MAIPAKALFTYGFPPFLTDVWLTYNVGANRYETDDTSNLPSEQPFSCTGYASDGVTQLGYFIIPGSTSDMEWVDGEDFNVGWGAQYIDYVAGAPASVAEAPMTMIVAYPSGVAEAPMEMRVYTNGVAEAPMAMVVLDSLETARWTARVLLGGVDVSAQLTGSVSVDAEEGAARVASFTLLPAPGVVNPIAWTGAAVSVDVVRVTASGLNLPTRVFTGVVDVAQFDQVGRSVTFACTDDLQNRVAALTKTEIDAIVGGRFHVGAQGEVDEHWAYAQARMESVAGSLDAGPYGEIRVTPWDGLSSWHTFTDDDDVLGDTSPPAMTPPRRIEIVNRIDINYQYRYYRCRERHAHIAWSKSVIGVDATASGYQYPTRDMVDAALDGCGWHRVHTAYNNAPAQIPIASPAGYYIEASGLSSVSAWMAQRHAQTVTEQYTLTVTAPSSISANGELAKPLRGALASNWAPDEWEQDFSITTPDASSAEADYAGNNTRAESDACILTLLDMAMRQILASHRQARQKFAIPCLPEIDLTHAVSIDTDFVAASGKVVRVEHVLDIDAGTADTYVTLALSGIAAGGIVTPSNWVPPAFPDLDAATGTDPWQAGIPAHTVSVGAVSGHAYSDALMGYLVNAPETFRVTNGTNSQDIANPYYDAAWAWQVTGWRAQMPGVAETHRNPLTLPKTAAYEIEIPEDALTLTIP